MLVLRTGRRWLPVPLAAAGLVALAACGGGDSTAPATDPTSTASADAFAECMTEQGVPAPQGGTRITGPGPGEPGQQQGAPVTRATRRLRPTASIPRSGRRHWRHAATWACAGPSPRARNHPATAVDDRYRGHAGRGREYRSFIATPAMMSTRYVGSSTEHAQGGGRAGT